MRFPKVRDPETKKLVADRSSIVYNSRITLSGIPEGAYRYMPGSRSGMEWIVDRFQVKTDKASGIVNDPNDWSREVGDSGTSSSCSQDRHGQSGDDERSLTRCLHWRYVLRGVASSGTRLSMAVAKSPLVAR